MIKYELFNDQDVLLNKEIAADKKNLVLNGNSLDIANLGWLNPLDACSEQNINNLLEIANDIRNKYDTFIVLGIGGSNNGARAICSALEFLVDGPEIIWAATDLSPYSVLKIQEIINSRNCCVEVIAKNFETIEPGIWFRVARQLLEAKYGREEAANRIVCCGTENSLLHRIATEERYRFISFPKNIGGRFSFLSNVGLLPVAVSGLDLKQIVEGAIQERQDLLDVASQESPALKYAFFRNLVYKKSFCIELLTFFEPVLNNFSKWWIQLFAESEGKNKKGIFPQAANCSEDLHSLGQYIQEGKPIIFETVLDILDKNKNVFIHKDRISDGFEYLNGKSFLEINEAAMKGTIEAHGSVGIPVGKITIPKLDEKSLGALFYFFQIACYISSSFLNVDCFSQPGVEAYKKRMMNHLGKEESQN
ncbi:MAG: glucose-6-phosphate isomerase [Saccharofermentanales bacterium]